VILVNWICALKTDLLRVGIYASGLYLCQSGLKSNIVRVSTRRTGFSSLVFMYCIITLPPYCNQSVCISVPRLTSQKQHGRTSLNFYALCVWPWLSPVAALRYAVYFRFCGWRHVFILWIEWWRFATATASCTANTPAAWVRSVVWYHRGRRAARRDDCHESHERGVSGWSLRCAITS